MALTRDRRTEAKGLPGRGIDVRLFEMKPRQRTPAQVSDDLAELVCSNSFRGASIDQAVGAVGDDDG